VTTDSTLPSMELRTGRPGPCRNFSKPLGSMYLNSASPMRVSSRNLKFSTFMNFLGIFQISWRASTVVLALSAAIALATSHEDLP